MKSYKPKKFTGKVFKNKNNKQDTRQERGYDGKWYAYRGRFLKHNPRCYMCGMKASVIDHILRARGNMEYFKEPNNHLSLCSSCHGSITQKFDRKEVQDLEGKLAYIKKMREFNKCSVKIKMVPYSKDR